MTTPNEQILGHIETLKRRVLKLEDEREIRDLLMRYGCHADACLDDKYVDLFRRGRLHRHLDGLRVREVLSIPAVARV